MAEPCFPSQLKEFPFTQDEIAALWRHAKDNYIDKGIRDIDATIKGVSVDLGLKYNWVAKALTEPKAIRSTSLEMYRKISDRNLAVRQAKDIVHSIDTPQYKKVIGSVLKTPFSIAVYGHGTVGMITHAGANIFRPTAWNVWGRNFARQFKFFADKGVHEAAMQELIQRDNFNLFKRAGLANDPAATYTDYGAYAKFFGAEWGRRGFDSLKLMRQDMADKIWERVPQSIKDDPEAALEMARAHSEAINHATGVITMRQDSFLAKTASAVNPIMFAAKLEASRWARVIGDPIKTVDTFANWKNSSAGERSVALTRVRNAAEFAAVYYGTLLANQAFNDALGTGDKVNITDPTQSDWLKHKVAGHTVMVDGGLLSPIRLLARLVARDLIGPPQQLRGESRTSAVLGDIGQYALGKASPTVSIAKELMTGETFDRREVPVSLPKLAGASSKYAKGKEPMSVPEYLASHGPIPLAGATKEIYDSLRENGMDGATATTFIRGLATFGIEMTGARFQESIQPQQNSNNQSTVAPTRKRGRTKPVPVP